MPIEMIHYVYRLADDIDEALGYKRVSILDIGGGLSLNYSSDEVQPTFLEYFDAIHEKSPLFFRQKRRIVTEFGRAWVGKAGAVVSRVEDVVYPAAQFRPATPLTAITHAGADMFLRPVWL
jgi:diaminopimelate decarboxylase